MTTFITSPFFSRPFLLTITSLGVLLWTGAVSASAAAAKSKGSRGVDPETLQLNTLPEPDLNRPGMADLFNGKDLTGWSVRGGPMPWVARAGMIVGTCDPKVRLNSFLATDTNYSNFLFTAEYRWEVPSNSGVMFRAATRPLDAKETAKAGDASQQRVFGFQCEVESSSRGWTGGIYGEAMGGWKYPLAKEKEHAPARGAVTDLAAWNRVTIEAKGDRIRTWVNGIPCANLTSEERTDGFIALQVHQGRKGEIHWRNLRLKTLEP